MVHRKHIIVTRTPLRMSFAGGGTDLPAFYEHEYGAVLSMAIDKYIYVTVKRHGEIFNEPVRLNYSKTELVMDVDEIENDLVRECLKFLEIDPPLYISTIADLPASSGLGGSSSFAVGLLNALHAYKGERVSGGQLAEEASYIEMEALKQPIGKQDQYAAAFGGLNFFRFQRDGGVTVDPLHLSNGMLSSFFDHLMVFWTGIRRNASVVLAEQRQNTQEKMSNLVEMRGHAHHLRELVSNGNFDPLEFGKILDKTWRLKRGLAKTISSGEIDMWYTKGIEAGAAGGKICGAGGGGFFLFVVPEARREHVRRALGQLTEISIGYEVQGSQVLIT